METSLVISIVIVLSVLGFPWGSLQQPAIQPQSVHVIQRRPRAKLSRSQTRKYRGRLHFCVRGFTLAVWRASCAL